MKSVFDLRLFLFFAATFSGFYFGDTQFSQAAETGKPTAAELENYSQLNADRSGASCVQLSGTYTLDAPTDCSNDSVMPDFLALGCSSSMLLPGQKLVIEQKGCEQVVLRTFSMVDQKNEHALSNCEVQISRSEASRNIAEELFHVAKGDLEVFKSSQVSSLTKKALHSKIFFKASVSQNPVKVQLKGGLKLNGDGSLVFKTVKARKADQLEKIPSACTLRRI